MEQREWYASGKERTPGKLLKYTLFVLTGVAFALGAIIILMTSRGNFGQAFLWGLISGAAAAVIGVIVWFIYRAVVLKKQ